MMVRWMCGVSLKNRSRSVDLYSLLGVHCSECGGLRWFEHLECKGVNEPIHFRSFYNSAN